MLQVIALASTRFTRLGFKKGIERIMRAVLAVLFQDLKLPIVDQCLVDQARKHRIIEKLFHPELIWVFRAGRSVEVCPRLWSRLRMTGEGGFHRTAEPAASCNGSLQFFFRLTGRVDFNGYAEKAEQFCQKPPGCWSA